MWRPKGNPKWLLLLHSWSFSSETPFSRIIFVYGDLLRSLLTEVYWSWRYSAPILIHSFSSCLSDNRRSRVIPGISKIVVCFGFGSYSLSQQEIDCRKRR